jgi:thioredoxin-like negative regulator of GroEL
MSTITELLTPADFDAHISSLPPTTLLILNFYTPWAASCAQMTTVLKTLASSYPVHNPPSTSWVSVNADKLFDVTEAYDVTAVPFLVLARGGKVLKTVRGCDAIKVRKAVEQHAGNSLANRTTKGGHFTACTERHSWGRPRWLGPRAIRSRDSCSLT